MNTNVKEGDKPYPDIVGLVLASGRGRRFDPTGKRNKLLAPMADQRAVLAHAVAGMRAVLATVAVVAPPESDALKVATSDQHIQWIENPDFEQGMGHAIGHGIARFPNARGWLIALGDMPYVGPDILHRLVLALEQGASAVAPVYQGERGHPVGFGAVHAAQLASLKGDRGARTILSAPGLLLIETDDSGILRDIDFPEDLAP